MNKTSLKELFTVAKIDSILEPRVLLFQVSFLYFIIKDWYFKDKIRNISLYKELIINTEEIKTIKDVSEIINITKRSYPIALLEKVSNVQNNKTLKCIEYINKLKTENIFFYGITIISQNNNYVIFVYHMYNIVLLIDMYNLNINKFITLEECINNVNEITDNKYTYQFIRVIRRSFS